MMAGRYANRSHATMQYDISAYSNYFVFLCCKMRILVVWLMSEDMCAYVHVWHVCTTVDVEWFVVCFDRVPWGIQENVDS